MFRILEMSHISSHPGFRECGGQESVNSKKIVGISVSLTKSIRDSFPAV